MMRAVVRTRVPIWNIPVEVGVGVEVGVIGGTTYVELGVEVGVGGNVVVVTALMKQALSAPTEGSPNTALPHAVPFERVR